MIIINGIHESGKSYLCEKLKKSHNIPIYAASQLISEYKNALYNANKFVDYIDDNQYALVEMVKSIGINKHFILDGHLCLLNYKGEICRINDKVIIQLNPSLILTKISDAHIICERLKIRDSQNYEIDFLEKFQNEEINYAKELASKLKIKQLTVNDDTDEEKIIEIIRSVQINGRSI